MSSIQQLTNALESGMILSWEEQDGSKTLIILNQDDWKVLDEDHEDNEWGEPILYQEETTRSITLDYIHNQNKKERKGDDEETNEDDNAFPKGLKEEVSNPSISSMDAQQKEIDLLTEYRSLWEEWKKIDEFYKPNPEYPKCVICKEHLSGTPYGNNPQPIRKKGKCCDRCNNDKVIPARMSGSILGGNPFGSMDEQILCRKIQAFTPVRGRTKQKYPRIWEAFQENELEDEIADVIKQFYEKVIERGVFPIISVVDGGITFTDMFSAIQDGRAVIRGIKK